MATEQRATSLLSLISSKVLEPGGFDSVVNKEKADDQRANTMMYAARMKYLQDSDQVQPDTLFMTRKQAQKLAKQGTVKTMVSMRKLEVGGGDPKGGGSTTGAAAGAAPHHWKKQRGGLPLDDRQQNWVPLTQAGCHFWQSQETGECRSVGPAGWAGQPHPDLVRHDDDEGDEDDDEDNTDSDDPPFPTAFAFLNSKTNKA